MEDIERILELTPVQNKAIASLKRAITKCEKSNVGFFNILDDTYAYDKSMMTGIEGRERADIKIMPCEEYSYPVTKFGSIGGCSFADDQTEHYIQLTEKGKKVFEAC